MSTSAPLVEDRLRHALASLESLHRLAAFISQPQEIALFDDLPSFAHAVASFTRAVRVQLDALAGALSDACRRMVAPGKDTTALQPPDRVIYLQGAERDMFDRLDKQARAFGVLTSALDHYISDLRHADGQTLSDMATLVRAQGHSTLRTADEIEAVASRIQEEAAAEQLQAFRRELEQPQRRSESEKGGAE